LCEKASADLLALDKALELARGELASGEGIKELMARRAVLGFGPWADGALPDDGGAGKALRIVAADRQAKRAALPAEVCAACKLPGRTRELSR
jgi:hypothetical protein